MPFIGIIAKENDFNFIKKTIIKNFELDEFKVININRKNIENIKNIKFEVLIVNENIELLLNDSKYLEKIIVDSCYIIVNSDIKNNLVLINKLDSKVITYGLNKKATITVSSIKEDNVMICVQRKINGVNKLLIEEQEENVIIGKNNLKKTYNVIIIFTVLKLYGKNLKKI